MEKTLHDTCEETCSGNELDLGKIKGNLISPSTALEVSDWFKALGDPTRVKIIHALLQSEMCVHDLTQVLEMGQSAVSHQLRLLRNVRMVKRRKVGKTVYYSVDDDHVEEIFGQTLQHVKHD
ncbi:ArsR/SmtB family transcription factor [Paenibacillus sp. GCM10012307]|uniref:Helix-turn-helix transcriptional regulator n=1 Tax=Paenibacillus roseus TaxID=2798579 RepID=A0A934J2K2_9BACL|nr:metalloregulator ArsR/SmtB family transcription factor [Paenibacillus roseus]MBJ6363617.1 helix-turn-helix transcriptional regulator [Paenibacillus roseus]